VTRLQPPAAASPGSPRREPRGELTPPHRTGVGQRCHAFTLTELLVAVAIILVLMTMIGGAVSAARGSQKKQATQALIAKLDAIVMAQLSRYESMSVPIPTQLPAGFSTNSEYRSWYIRRNLISGDMPDRWADVAAIASGTTVAVATTTGTTFFPLTGPQRAYSALWRSGSTGVTDQFAGAECLFMIVMRSGVADCLDCGGFRAGEIGDQDTDSNGNIVGDGMPEFLDAWGKPIHFLLWPAGVQLPAGSNTNFFSGKRTLAPAFPGPAGPAPSANLGMRPLIFSAGPDGQASINVGITAVPSNILSGNNCGNPVNSNVANFGSVFLDPSDGRADNITNFDAEAKQ
jgi:prepilin-type N-terminal cleavage/methylation domain-containing protein